MRHAACALALWAVTAGSATCGAGDFVGPGLRLEQYGLYCPSDKVGEEDAPGTERGKIDLIEGAPQLIASVTTVPAIQDIAFGLRYRLAEGAESATAYVVMQHPPFGTPTVTVERYAVLVNDQSLTLSQFSFDMPYEMVLGTWVLQVEIDGETVIQKTFEVVPPEQSPFSLKMCRGPALMS